MTEEKENRNNMTQSHDATELAVAGLSSSVAFVAADAADRWLASYDPSGPPPTDKFTSAGATMANTLNQSSPLDAIRVGVGVAAAVLPAAASVVVESPTGKAALRGAALGATASIVGKLFSNWLMPMIVGTEPQDVTPEALKKSLIARLYPAQVSAHVSLEALKDTKGPFASTGVLSAPQLPPGGLAMLAGDSPYDSASDALRRAAGLLFGDSPYPDTHEALMHQAGLHGDSPYPSTGDALRRQAGMGWSPRGVAEAYTPAGPPGQGPGPRAEPGKDSSACGCIGDRYSAFLGDSDPNSGETSHHTFGGVRAAVIRETDAAGFRNRRMNGIHR